ncbi:hypothetical protein [Bacillus cereus group sp. BfR-BA-01380]|uniref:hypothetical protein n=1 Tax=Bacillus cereus group sp. BfR-BA-01380 TaxID=2920324 RepID=UPI001F58BD89|nr:hypothetical protein [Bacillus cereus group sp. BfR-BA-01380]
MKQRPWYLRDKFLYTICIVIPLIGYIIVVFNKRKFDHEEWMPFLLVSTITTSLWVLKFLPNHIFLPGTILALLLIYILIKN